MLYLIGLGLSSERDISVRGLEIVKRASRVYLEAYTSILLVDKSKLVSGNFPPLPRVSSPVASESIRAQLRVTLATFRMHRFVDHG